MLDENALGFFLFTLINENLNNAISWKIEKYPEFLIECLFYKSDRRKSLGKTGWKHRRMCESRMFQIF